MFYLNKKGKYFYLIQSVKVKSKLWCYIHKAILHKNYYILTMVTVCHTNTVHTLHAEYFFSHFIMPILTKQGILRLKF